MNRRFVLRAMTSGLAITSVQNLLPKGFAQTNQDLPGLLTAERGSRIAISIFHTEQSIQPSLIKSLAARFVGTPGRGWSAALLASVDGTRAIVYKSGPPGPENAPIEDQTRIGTISEAHEYEMIYLSQKSNGKELSIATGASPITLINAFSTSPDRQQQPVATWIRNAPDAEAFPRFEAAVLHRSSDGTSVVNFARWQSQEAWMTMAKALSNKFREKNPLGQADPHLYRTVCAS